MEIKLDRIIYHLNKFVFCFFLLWFFGIGNVMAEGTDTLKIRNSLIFSGYAQYGQVLATNPYLRQANALDDKVIEFAAISFQVLTIHRFLLIRENLNLPKDFMGTSSL